MKSVQEKKVTCFKHNKEKKKSSKNMEKLLLYSWKRSKKIRAYFFLNFAIIAKSMIKK